MSLVLTRAGAVDFELIDGGVFIMKDINDRYIRCSCGENIFQESTLKIQCVKCFKKYNEVGGARLKVKLEVVR